MRQARGVSDVQATEASIGRIITLDGITPGDDRNLDKGLGQQRGFNWMGDVSHRLV